MTCPRCRWPVARLGLCDHCEASDQTRLHGQVQAPIPGAVPAPVRQMGSRQAEMAQRGSRAANGGREVWE